MIRPNRRRDRAGTEPAPDDPVRPRDRTRRRGIRGRFRRMTPRRWLPFLLLIGVVAIGIVASREDLPEPVTRPVTTPGEQLPVAAPSDALSTAFFCPGGSALGADGRAELTIIISNAGMTDASADIDFIGDDGASERLRIDVPAYGITRIPAVEHIGSRWVAATVDVLGGDVAVQQHVTARGVGTDRTSCPTSTADEWYAPAGSTAIGAEEHLLVYNPFPAPAVVSFAFTTGGSTTTPRPLQGVTIEGRSLRVFSGEDLPARRDELATHLTSRTGRVVLARAEIFDGEGAEFEPVREAGAVPAPEGLSITPAIPTTSTRWLFPTAVNDDGVRNAVVIHNPGEHTAEIDLVLSYTNRELNAEIEPIQVTVRPGELQTVDLRDRPGLDDGIPYQIFLDSFATSDGPAVPVVAELQMFGAVHRQPDPVPSDDAEGDDAPVEEDPIEADPDGDEAEPADEPRIPGYTVLAGSPVAAGRWIAPEVDLSGDAVHEVAVVNPSDEPVNVTVDIVAEDRRERSEQFELAPGDRRRLVLEGHDERLGVIVSADGAGVVVGQTWVGPKRGVSATLASPVPGTVRTLPPPVLD